MREIKFRGWHIAFKKMFYNIRVSTESWQTEDTHFGGEHNTLMQYTGLKDKNGKEVYEGDIVRCGTEDNIITAEVGFEDGDDGDRFFSGFATKIIKVEEYPEEGKPGWDDDYRLEIIGNIYSNPESKSANKR